MRATPAKLHSTGLLQEASVQMGVSLERLDIAVRAARDLGDAEIQFLDKLLRWIDAGASQDRRTAMSRGLARALEATPASAPADPLAAVDDPLDGAAAAESIALAEMESQTLRESILKDCLDVGEAGRLTGRSPRRSSGSGETAEHWRCESAHGGAILGGSSIPMPPAESFPGLPRCSVRSRSRPQEPPSGFFSHPRGLTGIHRSSSFAAIGPNPLSSWPVS